MDPLAGNPISGYALIQATPTFNSDNSLNSLRAEWIAACLKFNETASEESLNQAFSIFPVEMVCMEVLQKGLAEIGDLWYENRANVQQEHFASGLAMRRLNALLRASPVPTRKHTIIVGCPAHEWHAFTPLLLSLLLRRRGLNTIYLGANVPEDQFASTVLSIRANLVILVAQTLITAATLQQTALTMANQDVPMAYGGRIFNLQPSIVGSIPAHFLGGNLIVSLDEIERLLQTKKTAVQAKHIPKDYLAAHKYFNSRRTEIELTVRKVIQPLSISLENLMSGIVHLGDNIAASLQLGDINYVSGEMDWLKTPIKTHGQSMQELVYFMNTYAKSVDQHINDSGRLIIKWLSSEIDRLRA
jgi:methanogenic corrinoid protein MtbC1